MAYALKRTPPKASPNKAPILHHNSEPDLSSPASDQDALRVTFRNKRKHDFELTAEFNAIRDDIMSSLNTLRLEQGEKFTLLQVNLDAIKAQNAELQNSVEKMSNFCDDLMGRVAQLEKIRKTDLEYINLLEDRVESLERGAKTSSLEIRNVPKKHGETKEDLMNIVKSIGVAMNIQIQPHDIRDVYRLGTKNPNLNGPITAEFTSVIKKDALLTTIKKHNRVNKDNRLNTSHINMNGTSPIYISESLTTKAKKLFYQAREFTKANDYAYRWTAQGKIFIKKKEGEPAKRIVRESDFDDLKEKVVI